MAERIVQAGEYVEMGPTGDLLEINAEVEVGDQGTFNLDVRGTRVAYNASKKLLSCGELVAPLAPVGSVVKLRILLDRGSIEVFGNDGRIAMSRALSLGGTKPGLSLTVPATRPPVTLRSLRIYELGSAWTR